MSAQTRADPYKTIQAWEILALRGSQAAFRRYVSTTKPNTNAKQHRSGPGARLPKHHAEATTPLATSRKE